VENSFCLPGFAWLLHSCFSWTLVLKDELPELGAAEDPENFEDQTSSIAHEWNVLTVTSMFKYGT